MYKQDDKPNVRELTMLYGIAFPSDSELIMMILGTGTQRVPIEYLAERVLSVVEGTNPPELVNELLKVEGIGQTKALMIAAALELGRRLNRKPQGYMNKPADIVPYIQHYAMQSSEHFLVVSLNGAREILSIHVVCVGAANMAIVRPREVFSEPIKEHASAVVLAHNHPSGMCAPSKADRLMTENLVRIAAMLGIAVVDHLILTKEGYYSLLEHNELPSLEEVDKI